MAATPVYDLAIPAPYDTSFTDGERALSISSTVSNAAARITRTMSRYMNFLGGTYTLKILGDGAAVMWVGRSRDSMRVLYGSVALDGVAFAQVHIPAGLQRIDVVVSNLSASVGAAYVAFSLSQSGQVTYSSVGDDWLFDVTAIADSELLGVGDQRRLMPIFTVLPNWQGGITERISYFTDIKVSETDSEQRRALRRNARRSFEAGFLRSRTRRARLDNFLVGIGSEQCLVPLWHEQFTITTALTTASAGLVFPADTLRHREFRVGDLVFVNNGEPDDYDILEVATVDFDTDTITWVDLPVRNWTVGTYVIPLRVNRVIEAPTLQNLTDRVSTLQARFEIDEAEIGAEPSWGYCAPLFRFKVDRSEALSVGISRRNYILDNDIGIKEVFDPGQRAELATRAQVKLFGRNSVYSMRAFIQMARGRARRFYWPSLTQGMDPVTVISGTVFDVRPGGFAEYMRRPQDTRRLFAVVFKDGRPSVYRNIIGVESVLSPTPPYLPVAERLTIDKVIAPIQYQEVERVMFIEPSRFDQDTFELHHHVNDSAAVSIALMVRSSVVDEMPPIDCVITSHPYPIEVFESLASAATPLGVEHYSPLFGEDMVVGADITGGELSTVLLPPIVIPNEDMASEATVLSGELRAVLLPPIVIPHEDMASEATVLGGTLHRILLGPYVMQTEALESTATITGGSLT